MYLSENILTSWQFCSKVVQMTVDFEREVNYCSFNIFLKSPGGRPKFAIQFQAFCIGFLTIQSFHIDSLTIQELSFYFCENFAIFPMKIIIDRKCSWKVTNWTYNLLDFRSNQHNEHLNSSFKILTICWT